MGASKRSLGEKTADGVLHNGPTRLAAILIITDGTNPADIIIYDNNSAASGLKLFEGGVAGNGRSKYNEFNPPIKAENGMYLDITGTGASCIIYTA